MNIPKQEPSGLVRIVFELGGDTWHGFSAERVWAAPVAGGRFRLRNSPFYAHGVSFEDVVFAKPGPDGSLIFSGVSIRSGHSTYRVFAKSDIGSDDFQRYWTPLRELGCSFEQATAHYLSMDVPPSADIRLACELLQAGESAGAWEFEEGHCGHLVN